ncbi:TetR/AcrR family transcriptional regulator [Pseudooceanicola sediminis]|uniref:TetR/AcrR family transcriptional regulator n=2 Tax=Pseudooceanicola sediminis TaxID=2211117 RepID=A0A399IYZ6_9RHOB|nr:TetR/AcrR family transcriptional regulator [Puniceibacterium sp. HSS470]RII38184.1 TetR/AcrR family transcriptional regulator [Pseudooceanicola sediminis]|tara:strand:- start:40388 stop:41023 length:636 start_codon:yes stop_codon:yes gene_type:complete
MQPDTHRTAQGAARIQALTDTAAELFLERGYEGVSIDELIGRVGGSRRNVYGRFGGKQGLFIEVVTRLCDEQAQPLRNLDIGVGGIGPALTMFGERVLEIVLQPRTLALHRLMIAEGQRFPDLSQAILRSGHEAGTAILGEWLRGRPGLRHGLSPEIFAEQFVLLLTAGPQLRALTGHNAPLSPADRAHHVRVAVSTFLHGALPGDNTQDA